MTFKKTDNRKYYNPVRKAVLTHSMIDSGEKVAVGMSGGKDSSTLFYLLDMISKQERLGYSFEIVPIFLDMGMDMDIEPLIRFTKELGYELEIVPTDIATVVFDIRQEKNPCSLCANMRRGYLYGHAKKLGCEKVALGHHLDDAIETYLMNFLIHGRMESFEPISFLTRTEVSIIRPMLYLEEKDIISFAKRENLPVIHNPCPVDKKTRREEMKKLVTTLATSYPDIRQKFLSGMETGKAAQFWTENK
ncbi:PP-loop domain-containing protein [Listeria floridensis FSL S10-1187]|uniref:PP-loop domain-containing protein n=1 Tax=Listeria floridensis FSL S10-1187 TaxID=1265817 RepID=A0ABN0RGZ3_9LIST|nr:ATP-binding protein [Listeria floridensis]EUJ33188.1 PP-loop domain-containing protein [Listeria floridensis FSL S10-1187]